MTPRKQHYAALVTLLSLVGMCGLLGYVTQSRIFILPVLVALLAYAIWNIAFSCPKCGTPYLYEFKGIFIVPTGFPKRCRGCGWPTNQRYDGEH